MIALDLDLAVKLGTFVAVVGGVAWAKLDAMRATKTAKTVASNLTRSNEEVSSKLEKSETGYRESLRQIHALVNGNMGAVLHKLWLVTDELADLKKTPQALEIARLARDDYESHMARQQLVDTAAKEALKAFTDTQMNARQSNSEGPISAT